MAHSSYNLGICIKLNPSVTVNTMFLMLLNYVEALERHKNVIISYASYIRDLQILGRRRENEYEI